MSLIGANFSEDQLQDILQKSVQVGDIFYVSLDSNDGMVLKNGFTNRYKYFVVLGFDENELVYGGLVFNSFINQKVSTSIKDYHYPIRKENHPFLDHDSFVNCSRIITSPRTKLLKSECKGRIDESDIDIIIDTVSSCPMIEGKYKKRFKLI